MAIRLCALESGQFSNVDVCQGKGAGRHALFHIVGQGVERGVHAEQVC